MHIPTAHSFEQTPSGPIPAFLTMGAVALLVFPAYAGYHNTKNFALAHKHPIIVTTSEMETTINP